MQNKIIKLIKFLMIRQCHSSFYRFHYLIMQDFISFLKNKKNLLTKKFCLIATPFSNHNRRLRTYIRTYVHTYVRTPVTPSRLAREPGAPGLARVLWQVPAL